MTSTNRSKGGPFHSYGKSVLTASGWPNFASVITKRVTAQAVSPAHSISFTILDWFPLYLEVDSLVYVTTISSLYYCNSLLNSSFALSFIYKIIFLNNKSGHASTCLKTYMIPQTFNGKSLCSLASHKIPI